MKSFNAKIELSFLWHMHQPDYRDAKGIMRMPWVFLHAIKDYYDMPWMLSKFPNLKANFNLTPPLIEQLKLYENPLENDYFLSLWHKNPEELNQKQRDWLIKTCKSANYEMMVKKNSKYLELYYKDTLTDSELINLEVLFLLVWSGPYIKLHNGVVQELLDKVNYTSDDKIRLFDTLIKFVSSILPFYASLLKSKQISLSTTPYNHPILPLLLDMDNIEKANPNSTPPNNSISLYDDAKEQVSRAIELYKDVFKNEPIGFWPAEGAVDEETIKIYKDFGIKWIATDETILFKSLKDNSRTNLYKPYKKDDVNIYFRDHGLSDLFGFDYRFKPSSQAVEHFIESIKNLQPKEIDEINTVFIILDGENAWEYYQNNGYSFFMQLYEELNELDWCKTETMDNIAFRDKSIPLKNLASGSWIYGDFTTWSGHPEKNSAWDLIFQTKKDYLKLEDILTYEVKEKIKFHFLASECSDWFWWYGDDHNTSFAVEFDKLFRGHLIAIYELMKENIPINLLTPIIKEKNKTIPIIYSPNNTISPDINGEKNNFFEWIDAGKIDESSFYSTMDRARGPIEIIKYGFDDDKIYILFEGNIEELQGDKILIDSKFLDENLTFNIKSKKSNFLEFSINRNLFSSSSNIELHFEIKKENKIIQSLPSSGILEINLDKDYSQNWFI